MIMENLLLIYIKKDIIRDARLSNDFIHDSSSCMLYVCMEVLWLLVSELSLAFLW